MNNAPQSHTANMIPYPARLIGDVGLGFVDGMLFSSAYALFKGFTTSSNGNSKHPLIQGLQAVHKNGYGSRLGGRLAAWTALFHAFHITYDTVTRTSDQKERSTIYLGAWVGGFVNIQRGIGAISKWAVLGGVIGALPQAYIVIERKSLGCSPMEESYLHRKEETIWTKDAQTQRSPKKKRVLSYVPLAEYQKEIFLVEEHKEIDHNHNGREEKGFETQLRKPPEPL